MVERIMNEVLVAHRGTPERLPENSLAGYRAALEAGARLLETDVQLTAEGIPVLSHDDNLLRMTGRELRVTRTPWHDLRDLPASQPERFDNAFPDARIARLADFAALLAEWPQAQAFVEIKQESLDAFGTARVIGRVLECLAPVHDQCVLISFNADAVRHAHGRIRSGWVLGGWDDAARQTATQLAPDFLFVSRRHLPPDTVPLWPGPWQWAVYTVNEAPEVARYLARGVHFVETNVICTLLSLPEFRGPGHG
jgi:glycerophosphoryl diester phosphodiesterase